MGDSGSEGRRGWRTEGGRRESRSCCYRVRPLSSRLQRSGFHSDSAAAFVALLVRELETADRCTATHIQHARASPVWQWSTRGVVVISLTQCVPFAFFI